MFLTSCGRNTNARYRLGSIDLKREIYRLLNLNVIREKGSLRRRSVEKKIGTQTRQLQKKKKRAKFLIELV